MRVCVRGCVRVFVESVRGCVCGCGMMCDW